MILGTQESVAGGLHLAFGRLDRDRGEALQIFSKSSRQWNAKPLEADAIDAFRAARETFPRGPIPVSAHAAYLINLAAPDGAIWERSTEALLDECWRAERLGVDHVIVHPGATMGRPLAEGFARVARSLRYICGELGGARVRLLMEVTAGQGTCVGCSFEHLAELLDRAGEPRLGVCLDTQHMWAAGIDWTTPRGYERTFNQFDKLIGLKHIHAFHLNDSKKPLGMRVDRHERIGDGLIGLAPFRRLVRDPRFASLPGYLETPPLENGEESYAEGLMRLRSLRTGASRARGR